MKHTQKKKDKEGVFNRTDILPYYKQYKLMRV